MPIPSQKCVIVTADRFPQTGTEVTHCLSNLNAQAAYVIVGHQMLYLNALEECEYLPWDSNLTKQLKTQIEIENRYYEANNSWQTPDELDQNHHKRHKQDLTLISQQTGHQHHTLFELAQKGNAGDPIIARVVKSPDGKKQQVELLLNEAQEHHFITHAADRTLTTEHSSEVTYSQLQSIKYQARAHKKLNELANQPTYYGRGLTAASIEAEQEHIAANVALTKQFDALIATFIPIEQLINNDPAENPLEKLSQTLTDFKDQWFGQENSGGQFMALETWIETNIPETTRQASLASLQKLKVFFETQLNTFVEKLIYYQQHPLTSKQLEHLFKVEDVEAGIHSLGRLETTLKEALARFSIKLGYDLHQNRVSQGFVKDPLIKKLAADKENARLRAGFYGSRSKNPTEAIPASMLQQQQFIATGKRSNDTAPTTKRWKSTKNYLQFSGDIEKQSHLLSVVTGQNYHDKQALQQETTREKAWRAIHPWLSAIRWPVALGVETGLAIVRLTSAVVLGAATFVLPTNATDKASQWVSQKISAMHESLSSLVGYKGAQRFSNALYKHQAHQAVLDELKKTPDSLFSDTCDRYLNAYQWGTYARQFVWDLGLEAWEGIKDVAKLSTNNRLWDRIWPQEDQAIDLGLEAELDAQLERVLIHHATTESASAKDSESLAAENSLTGEPSTAEANTKIPAFSHPSASEAQHWHPAKVTSAWDFIDELMVKGFSHALVRELFEESPVFATFFATTSLAAMAVTMGGIGGAAATIAAPMSFLAKAVSGKSAADGGLSLLGGGILSFKLPTAAAVLATKIYEQDFEFLRSVRNHPEALLGYALLTAVGYGFAYLPALPAHIGHTPIPDPAKYMVDSLQPEVAAAAQQGLAPFNSLTLAIFSLKTLVLGLSLLDGGKTKSNQTIFNLPETKQAIAAIFRKPEAERRQALEAFLNENGIDIPEPVKATSAYQNFIGRVEQSSLAKEPQHDHKDELNEVRYALQKQLEILKTYNQMGFAIKNPEKVYNRLNRLFDHYNALCAAKGLTGQEAVKDHVLQAFMLQHGYQGKRVGIAVLTAIPAFLYRRIKIHLTNSAYERAKIDFNAAESTFFRLHVPATFVEMGHWVVGTGTYIARGFGYIAGAFTSPKGQIVRNVNEKLALHQAEVTPEPVKRMYRGAKADSNRNVSLTEHINKQLAKLDVAAKAHHKPKETPVAAASTVTEASPVTHKASAKKTTLFGYMSKGYHATFHPNYTYSKPIDFKPPVDSLAISNPLHQMPVGSCSTIMASVDAQIQDKVRPTLGAVVHVAHQSNR